MPIGERYATRYYAPGLCILCPHMRAKNRFKLASRAILNSSFDCSKPFVWSINGTYRGPVIFRKRTVRGGGQMFWPVQSLTRLHRRCNHARMFEPKQVTKLMCERRLKIISPGRLVS